MYQENKLRAAFAMIGKSPRQICTEIGMSERTFYRKMKSGAWGTNEAGAIVKAAQIDEKTACEIFLS